MGMAFEYISTYGANPLIQNLISESELSSPMFGFKLVPSAPELFLGGVNPDYNEKDFTWVPLSFEVCRIFNAYKVSLTRAPH